MSKLKKIALAGLASLVLSSACERKQTQAQPLAKQTTTLYIHKERIHPDGTFNLDGGIYAEQIMGFDDEKILVLYGLHGNLEEYLAVPGYIKETHVNARGHMESTVAIIPQEERDKVTGYLRENIYKKDSQNEIYFWN